MDVCRKFEAKLTYAVVVLEVAGDAVGLFGLGGVEVTDVVQVPLTRLAGGGTGEVPGGEEDDEIKKLNRVRIVSKLEDCKSYKKIPSGSFIS